MKNGEIQRINPELSGRHMKQAKELNMKEREKMLQKKMDMNGDEEYIQLPPMERWLSGEFVRVIWEYAKLSQEEKDKVYQDLLVVTGEEEEAFEERKAAREVEMEDIRDYVDAIKAMMRTIIFEASSIAAWVYTKKYMEGYTLEQMVDELPKAELFILAINLFFEG